MLLRAIPALCVLALASVVGCSSSDSSDGSSSSSTTFKCQVSSANSGSLCQVNFCDGGDGPAAYCDTSGKCKCGPAAENPKEFTSEGICDLDMKERASVANTECGFGM